MSRSGTNDPRQRIHIYMDTSFRERLRDMAGVFDLSMAAYVRRAVSMQMERDRKQAGEDEVSPGRPAWLQAPDGAA